MPSGWRAVTCLPTTSAACTGSSKRDGKMRGVEDAPLACLDANVFLAVLIPAATTAAREEITGVFGEICYVYLREGKPGFEIARAAIEAEPNLKAVAVTAPLAVHAAELRRKYYSKKNPFSYNDGLYLATGLAERANLLITSDPHLLGAGELKAIRPAEYR
ncbi:MAG: hypothetical protein DMG09_02470 [Acidobacteria bacterium]|nr:MAG: hypothetical protein DMG09_02470 [Acidobacteriota bacterium]